MTSHIYLEPPYLSIKTTKLMHIIDKGVLKFWMKILKFNKDGVYTLDKDFITPILQVLERLSEQLFFVEILGVFFWHILF